MEAKDRRRFGPFASACGMGDPGSAVWLDECKSLDQRVRRSDKANTVHEVTTG